MVEKFVKYKLGILSALVLIVGSVFVLRLIPQNTSESSPTNDTSSESSPPNDNNRPLTTSRPQTHNDSAYDDGILSLTTTFPPGTAPSEPHSINLGTSEPSFQTPDGRIFPLRVYEPLSTNDPYGSQWWTTNSGLPTAWSIGPGSHQTTVAIIDTGFALAHEDLSGRWAINTSEQGLALTEAASKRNCTDQGIALSAACNLIDDDYDRIVDNEIGTTTRQNLSQFNCTARGLPLNKSCNLIDDDANGYIDDVTGWDFANYDQSTQAGETNSNGDGIQHGSAVAGILGATGNNNKGITGVDWQTKILPIQAIDDDSYGNTLTVSRAIRYAAERDVDVINLSLGASAEDPYLRESIQYALELGTIIVAASGNDGCNCISYPAKYPEVVAVGAQGQNGSPASFSSYGAELDLLAPGQNMTTLYWRKDAPTSGYASGYDGTSFAAPYVSGLLSLARSHQPTAQWGELLAALLSTANHSTLTATSPFSTQLGSGYARADNLLTRLTTPMNPSIRYTFGPSPLKSTLSSSLPYQCWSVSDFPTAPLYEITAGTTKYYTIDELERAKAIARGQSVKYIARTCVGLPNDIPTTSRMINLIREIGNGQGSKD